MNGPIGKPCQVSGDIPSKGCSDWSILKQHVQDKRRFEGKKKVEGVCGEVVGSWPSRLKINRRSWRRGLAHPLRKTEAFASDWHTWWLWRQARSGCSPLRRLPGMWGASGGWTVFALMSQGHTSPPSFFPSSCSHFASLFFILSWWTLLYSVWKLTSGQFVWVLQGRALATERHSFLFGTEDRLTLPLMYQVINHYDTETEEHIWFRN